MGFELETEIGTMTVTESRGDVPEGVVEEAENGEVGIDTETTGLDWTSDELGMVQVFFPELESVYLVRPSEVVPERLIGLLESPEWSKVFHFAMFDLRFLAARWEFDPRQIFCTKISAKLLEPEREKHSLADLLEENLGVAMSKPQAVRTSDWTVSSLSSDQLSYAALDAVYLPRLFETLENELDEVGRIELANDCFSFVPSRLQADLLNVEDLFGY